MVTYTNVPMYTWIHWSVTWDQCISLTVICKFHTSIKEGKVLVNHQKWTTLSSVLLLLLLLLSCFSRVRLCATPWTAAHQARPSMGFSRQEYWSGVPLPSPIAHLIYPVFSDCCLLPLLVFYFFPIHILIYTLCSVRRASFTYWIALSPYSW